MHSPQRTHPADAGEYRVLPTDSTAPTRYDRPRIPCRPPSPMPPQGATGTGSALGSAVSPVRDRGVSDPEAVRNGVGISVWPRLERRGGSDPPSRHDSGDTSHPRAAPPQCLDRHEVGAAAGQQ